MNPEKTTCFPTRRLAAATANTTKVGVIGPGIMGTLVAAALMDAGFATVLLDGDLRKGEAEARGTATATADWQELAGCEIVITTVDGDAAMREIARRLSGTLRTYSVHLSMSAIAPATARELAGLHHSLGQQFVSAPVLGSPQLAASRDLLAFVAADEETLHRCMPLLECMCRQIFIIGDLPEQANRFHRFARPVDARAETTRQS